MGHSLEMVARMKQVRSRKPAEGESSGKSNREIKRWPWWGQVGRGDKGQRAGDVNAATTKWMSTKYRGGSS